MSAKRCLFAALLAAVSATCHAALPTTGKCAFTFLFPHPDFNFHNPNNIVGTTKSVDALGEFDFAAQTVTFNLTTATLNAVSAVNGNTWIFSQAAFSVSFANPAPTPLAGLPDAFTMTFGFTQNGLRQTMILNLLPANSNNTFLIQGVNHKFSGVCQMV